MGRKGCSAPAGSCCGVFSPGVSLTGIPVRGDGGWKRAAEHCLAPGAGSRE